MTEDMATITKWEVDKDHRAIKIFTINSKGVIGDIILSANFCHYCVDDLATEFAKFMKTKGHDIIQGKA